MRVQELLEAISLSVERDTVRKIIMDTIDKEMQYICEFVIHHDIVSGDVTNHKTLSRQTKKYLEHDLQPELQKELTRHFKRPPYNVFKITFDEMSPNIDGFARVENVYINKHYIDYIVKVLADSVLDYYGDEAFYEDGRVNNEGLRQVFANYKETSRQMDDKIEDLVGTIIHEVVHVQQHVSQAKNYVNTGKTEYRSYVANKKRFHQAMQNIYNNTASDEDMDIYRASPQEIPAFAHNLALELIKSAMMGYSAFTEDLNDARYFLSNMEDCLQYTLNYTTNPRFVQYNKFNTPENRQHYQVFKRFMKLVYREITNYTERLRAHIKKLEYIQNLEPGSDEWWENLK